MSVGKGSLKRVSAANKQEIVNVRTITENNIVEIDISSVDFRAKNSDLMLASVKTFGVFLPVIVAKDGDGFKVIDGRKRLTALKSLGEKTVKAVIVEGDAKSVTEELNKFAKVETKKPESKTENIHEMKFAVLKRLGEDDFPVYLL